MDLVTLVVSASFLSISIALSGWLCIRRSNQVYEKEKASLLPVSIPPSE